MKRVLLALTLVLGLAGVAAAQSPTTTLQYDLMGVLPNVVATYTQTIVVNGTPVSAAPVCTAKSAADTTCVVPIPALQTTGGNTLIITEALNGQTASLTITGLNPNNGPKQPGNGRVTVSVTVSLQ